MKKVKVMFVCMGNICRSPTAHGMFRQMVEQAELTDKIEIDSSGTHAYHVGNGPDKRALQAAAGRGLFFDDLRARQVCEEDFSEFEYILAMDKENHQILSDMCPAGAEDRLFMFMEFAKLSQATEVPDPYYGGADGFERVLDMVDDASAGLLSSICQQYGL